MRQLLVSPLLISCIASVSALPLAREIENGCQVSPSEAVEIAPCDLEVRHGERFLNGHPIDSFGADLRCFVLPQVNAFPLDMYATAEHRVYLLSPVSCGGEHCGGDYTGWGWGSFEVSDPHTFRWLSVNYAVDAQHVYFRWGTDSPAFRHRLMEASPENFRVMDCAEGRFGFGTDGTSYFTMDGTLISRESINARLRRPSYLPSDLPNDLR